MRRLLLVVPVVLLAAAGTAGAGPARHVQLSRGVVRLGQHAAISVSAIRTRSLEVRLLGATDSVGRSLPWRPLRLVGEVWVGRLPAPALRGVYPVELRTRRGGSRLRSERALLRVFARDTRKRPSFAAPAGAVRWWVRAIIGARPVAVKAWPRPAFDHREPRLHRLFVVAYSLPAKRAVRDRLGLFVEVFRDGYHARWRVLETTVAP